MTANVCSGIMDAGATSVKTELAVSHSHIKIGGDIMDISAIEFLTVLGTIVTIVARVLYIRSQIRSKNGHNKK